MTPTGRALAAVYGCALLTAVSFGGQFIGTARWLHAAAAYTVAGICLIGLLREVGRAIPPGDYTDDDEGEEGEPALVGEAYTPASARPRRMGRIRAARAARRAVQNMPCGCERYWSTTGLAHDPWCYLYEGGST